MLSTAGIRRSFPASSSCRRSQSPDFADRGYDPWSWYTVSEFDPEGKIKSGFVTYDQGELLRYFAKRHKKGEQLRLLKISLTHTGLLGKEDNVGFVYVLNRTARDLDPASVDRRE